MTEVKDKDLEKVGGGIKFKNAHAFYDPATGQFVTIESSNEKSNLKPTTENGYCENYQRTSLLAENCCKGCVHFIAAGNNPYCDLP